MSIAWVLINHPNIIISNEGPYGNANNEFYDQAILFFNLKDGF